MLDPIEQAMSDLHHLLARIATIERTASSPGEEGWSDGEALKAIARECRYLYPRIAQIRKTLDPLDSKALNRDSKPTPEHLSKALDLAREYVATHVTDQREPVDHDDYLGRMIVRPLVLAYDITNTIRPEDH